MKKLMEQLYGTRETNHYFKTETVGHNLTAQHPMVTKLNRMAHSIANSKECEYYTVEDVAQEVAYVILTATDKLITSGQITEQYIIDHLYTEDKLMARYWKYITIKLDGHIKNNLKKQHSDMNFSSIEAYGTEDSNGAEIIDNFLMAKSTAYLEEQHLNNPFNQWFVNNKERILTRTQLKFIETGGINENNNAPAFRKRIAKRVLEAYNKQYTLNMKEQNTMENMEILKELTSNKSLKALKKYYETDIVGDVIYTLDTTLEEKVLINEYVDGYRDSLPLQVHIKLICLFERKLHELEGNFEKCIEKHAKNN